MDIPPSQWMDRLLPGWDRSYADWMNISPSEWWARLYGSGMGRPAANPWTSGYRRGEEAYRRKTHYHEGGCSRCGSYPCECSCCIGDVDLAIYTRLGEQRIVQLVVENERRREKEIALELSEWTTRGGKAAPVATILLEPKAFTLAPCAEQGVTLAVKVQDAAQKREEEAEEEAGEAAAKQDRRQLPDVDDCLVATADLRLVGCDHRPLRIAVAVLPRDCDPYRVYCGCSCC